MAVKVINPTKANKIVRMRAIFGDGSGWSVLGYVEFAYQSTDGCGHNLMRGFLVAHLPTGKEIVTGMGVINTYAPKCVVPDDLSQLPYYLWDNRGKVAYHRGFRGQLRQSGTYGEHIAVVKSDKPQSVSKGNKPNKWFVAPEPVTEKPKAGISDGATADTIKT